MADVHGILLLDKPLHLSSAGAVARVKYLFRARKVGHTGSLDPLASGMLPICFGEATKFGSLLLDADKTYRVTVRLGERTPTADRESEVVERRDVPPLSAADLGRALDEFPRDYLQIPPMHSALKQDGKPLYEYARAGITRERAARPIVIREMRLLDWQTPDVTFDVRCTKGAYIRVLAEDLAARLDTVGHLAALRRLSVSPFDGAPVWTLAELEAGAAEGLARTLLPVDAALQACERLDVDASQAAALRQGRGISLPVAGARSPGTVRLYAPEAGFVGLGEITAGGSLRPMRLISADANLA